MRLSNGEVLLAWPLAQHIVTQGWFYNDGSMHRAIDLRTQIGNTSTQPVYAAEDGTVDQVQDWDGHTKTGMQSYGNMVRLKHAPYEGKPLQTRYAHLSRYCVKLGQQVKEGELIGYSGVTGNVFGAHLHFEVILNGSRTNPLVWLDGDFTTASSQVFTYRPGEHAVEKPADAAQPSGEEVLIDVSHHQGAIDWAKVPYRAIVRIGYRGYGTGKLMKDEQYDANLAGAKASGKLFGFYFFSQAVTVDEACEEADFCASLAPTGYPLFFDSEWGPDQGAAHGLRPSVLCTCGGAGLPAGRLHVYVVCHGKHRLRGPVQGLHRLAGRRPRQLRHEPAAIHPPVQPDRKGRRAGHHRGG